MTQIPLTYYPEFFYQCSRCSPLLEKNNTWRTKKSANDMKTPCFHPIEKTLRDLLQAQWERNYSGYSTRVRLIRGDPVLESSAILFMCICNKCSCHLQCNPLNSQEVNLCVARAGNQRVCANDTRKKEEMTADQSRSMISLLIIAVLRFCI